VPEEEDDVGNPACEQHDRGTDQDADDEDEEDGIGVHGREVRINPFRIP